MKNKNTLLSLLTTVVSLVLIVPMFLNLFGYTWSLGNNVLSDGLFGMFADYSAVTNLFSDFNSVGALIFDICLIAGVVLAGLYLLTFVLEVLNVKLDYSLIKKVLALLFAAVFVTALIGGILLLSNKVTGTYINHELKMIPQFGFFLALGVMLTSSVLAFLSSPGAKQVKSKSKKRRK